VNRGEIWWADLPGPVAAEPGYRRPVNPFPMTVKCVEFKAVVENFGGLSHSFQVLQTPPWLGPLNPAVRSASPSPKESEAEHEGY
jgi:hypothetical protein